MNKIILFNIGLLFLILFGCNFSNDQKAEALTKLPVVTPLLEVKNNGQQIDPRLVCMVNNAYMDGKEQIPVAFEGKLYYGCCHMCVDKIKTERKVRYAQDPFTGEEVDKALAFITLQPGSKDQVLYFKSLENFNRYHGLAQEK